MKTIMAAAVLVFSTSIWAAGHTVDVRVSNGMGTYSRTLRITDNNEQIAFQGPVGSGKTMIFNALMNPVAGKAAQYRLEYQLELSGGQGSQAPVIRLSNQVDLRPAVNIVAVECGAWTVELTLDGLGTLGSGKKKAASAAWDDAGLGNYRITADVTRVGGHERCRSVVAPGSMADVSDRISMSGKSFGLNFQGAATAAQTGTVDLQFELGYAPVGTSYVQINKKQSLTLGRETKVSSQGATVGLLVEAAAAPSAPQQSASAPRAATQAPSADMDSKAPPLLR